MARGAAWWGSAAASLAVVAALAAVAVQRAVPPDPEDPFRHRPLWVRAVNAYGSRDPLTPESVLAAVRRRVGLSEDAGLDIDDSALEGLRVLCASLRDEAELTVLGTHIAAGLLTNMLAYREQVAAIIRADPAVVAERIAPPPIVVLGMPRTGTTFLHGLLAQDPALRAPRHIEYTAAEETAAARIGQHVELASWHWLAPRLAAAHDIAVDAAEECVVPLATDMQGIQYSTVFHTPGYEKWVYEDGERGGFARSFKWHRKVLQLLQRRSSNETGGRGPQRHWLLKTPWFLPVIGELLAEYPGALVVHTHRDPRDVISSLGSIRALLQGMVSDSVNASHIAEAATQFWEDALRRGVAARDRAKLPPSQIVDVHFPDLLADPLGTAERIYAHFGLPLSAAAREAMRTYAEGNARGRKHGRHKHSLAKTGFDERLLMRRFAWYVDRFKVSRAADDARS